MLAHHSPFMSIIRPGALTITQDNKQSNYELNGGFIDVTPQGVTILAETINQK
ncbi:MAG: F0F1 ATP synthase subunit epsilon [Parvibaculales bacterium]